MALVKFIQENKQLVTVLVVWIFIHIIIYVYAAQPIYGRNQAKQDFFPFTEKSLRLTYDTMEFLIYGIGPCIAGFLLKLNSNKP